MIDLPYWYAIGEGTFCASCRRAMLREWSPQAIRRKGGDPEKYPDEVVRKSDFTALGRRPWVGNPSGERYMQCDRCLGQWGPDGLDG